MNLVAAILMVGRHGDGPIVAGRAVPDMLEGVPEPLGTSTITLNLVIIASIDALDRVHNPVWGRGQAGRRREAWPQRPEQDDPTDNLKICIEVCRIQSHVVDGTGIDEQGDAAKLGDVDGHADLKRPAEASVPAALDVIEERAGELDEQFAGLGV